MVALQERVLAESRDEEASTLNFDLSQVTSPQTMRFQGRDFAKPRVYGDVAL